jgi:hypothetical protein
MPQANHPAYTGFRKAFLLLSVERLKKLHQCQYCPQYPLFVHAWEREEPWAKVTGGSNGLLESYPMIHVSYLPGVVPT